MDSEDNFLSLGSVHSASYSTGFVSETEITQLISYNILSKG